MLSKEQVQPIKLKKQQQTLNNVPAQLVCENCEKIFKFDLHTEKVMLKLNNEDVSVTCWYYVCPHCGQRFTPVVLNDEAEQLRQELVRCVKALHDQPDSLQRKAEAKEIDKIKIQIHDIMQELKQLYDEQHGEEDGPSRESQESLGEKDS